MRLLTTFTLLTICLTAIGQTFLTEKKKTLTYYPGTYIDTESRYTDSTGKSVIIQNSLPKGGVRYTDATGQNFGYVIFWTRVINETATPMEFTINFPGSFPSPYSYLKLVLPPDTMTLDKESLYNYGVTDLESFLDTNFNKPTTFQKTINAKEECLFYVAVLSSKLGGAVRARLALEEHDLFYSVRGIAPELDSESIPCGQIVFKN